MNQEHFLPKPFIPKWSVTPFFFLCIPLFSLFYGNRTVAEQTAAEPAPVSHGTAFLQLLPELRAAKHIAGVDYATSGTIGNFDVITEIVVENTGTETLTDLHLTDNLSAPSQLGTAFAGIVTAPEIVPIGANGTVTTATANPGVNLAYAGTGDLLTGGGVLEPGQAFVVRFRYEVNPDAPNAPSNLKNQATAEGTGIISLIPATDASDSGFIPTSTNPGRPGDTGGSDDPTPLTNCWEQLNAGLSCNNNVQVSVNQNCTAGLTADMVLEGEIQLCASGQLLPLGAYYEVFMVTTQNGVPVPDGDPGTPNVYEISGSYIGQTLTVKIREIIYGNNCWGTIKLEDKLRPQFDCPTAPVQVDCDIALAGFPAPVLTDNCDPAPVVNFNGQQIIDNDICDDGIYRVRRTYAGFDQNGNQAIPCVLEIELTRPGVDFPKDIIWDCGQYDLFPNIVDPAPLDPGVTDTDPMDDDIDVDPLLPAGILEVTGSGIVGHTGGVCGYNVSSSDNIVATCGNSFKIIRTWTVIDWCTGMLITADDDGDDNVQVIKILDQTDPVITRPAFQVSANIPGQHPQPCRSQSLLLPPLAITDNCNPNTVQIQIITPVGEAIYINGTDGTQGGFIPPPGLPLGVHDVIYRATDACNNSFDLIVPVTVVDNITPTAVCDELTDANLTSDGFAEVFAATFDDGSHDNCCLSHFEVRRMDDPCDDGHDDTVFGPSVLFCCEDVDAGPQMVVFRVYDCFDNFNDCMVQVEVNDKQAPLLISCPGPASVSCDFYADNLETQLANLAGDPAAQNQLLDPLYGTATFYDNCDLAINRDIDINIDQCLEGTITRTWSATDPGGLESPVCSQTISVYHVSDWVVEFPEDMQVNCGEMLPEFGQPEIFFDDCEMIAVSFDQDTFYTVPGACFKIIRTWTVINWCVLGELTDEEVVEVPESQLGLPFPACDLDGDGDCDDNTFRDSWTATDKPGFADAQQQFGPDTDPDSDPWDGYITYQQVMKVIDQTDPVFPDSCAIADVCLTGADCTDTISLPIPDVLDCSPQINLTAISDFGSGFGPFTGVTPGTYNVTYTAFDNCNNQSTCTATVTVDDCKAPTVYCSTGLITELMDTDPPMVPVTASMLDDGSEDNCSDVFFSFSMDPADSVRIYTCDSLPGDSVTIWVTDLAGNQDNCRTLVTIQDNMDLCDGNLVVGITGTIDTESGDPVENVAVHLSGQQSGTWTTGTGGGYQFNNIPAGNDVSVTPVLDEYPLNGVTTFDLVLISKHVLGVQPLDSPYKIIAADANKSGGITTFDMVEIRKLILFIEPAFPNNTSWRFVDKHYQFPDPANPFQEVFPEVMNVNNIPADMLDADFIAVKTGDVNGSAQPNLMGNPVERSYDRTLVLNTPEQPLKKGETCTVILSAKNFAAIGFQFTLEFNPEMLQFEAVNPALTNEEHFGYTFIEEGFLTVSWNGRAVDRDDLVALTFRARANGLLSKALQLNSRYTHAEAYDDDGETQAVQLHFTGSQPDSAFELYQNVPNPFSEYTVIGFRLAAGVTARLTISDISGRTIHTIEQPWNAGYNEVRLHRSDLPGTGILYYRLETRDGSDTKMMMLTN